MSESRISLQPFGALKEGSLYIERAADRDLHEAILSGQFCFVSAPRQYGKSSLCAHACRSLQQKGVLAVTLELTQITRATEQQFFDALIKELADRLGWPAAKRSEFLRRRPSGSDESLWRTFLRQVVQESKHEVALFFDEVESLTEPGSDVGEFFVGLRDLAIRREVEPSFRKLAVCLVGQFPHQPDGTPDPLQNFVATCRRIQLEPFTPLDLRAFRPALEALGDSNAIVSAIYDWTRGHPYLTHRLCHLLRDAEPMLKHTERVQVDRAVERAFLQPGRPDNDFLQAIKTRLDHLNGTPAGAQQVSDVLRLYRRVLEQEDIQGNPNSRLQEELALLGLCRIQDGRLVLQNRITAQLFDKRWVLHNIPRTWFNDALDKWRTSSVDESARSKDLLLSGWQLAEAERWLDLPEHLNAVERDYIRLSQQFAQRTRTLHRAWPIITLGALSLVILLGASWIYFFAKSQEIKLKLAIAERTLAELEKTKILKDRQISELREEVKRNAVQLDIYKTKYDELILVSELDRLSLQNQANELETLKAEKEDYKDLLNKVKTQIAEKEKLILALRSEKIDLQKQAAESKSEAIANKKLLGSIPKAGVDVPVELNNNEPVASLSLLPNNKQLITATSSGYVHFGDTNAATKTSVKAHDGKVQAVAVHQGANRAASAGSDGKIILFELSDRRKLRTISAHPGGAIALTFSPDGKWLLSGGEDNNARIWDAISGDSVATFSGHTGPVSAIAFSGNSRYAITGSADKTARIWEYQNSEWRTKSTHLLADHKNWIAFVWLNSAGNRALVSTAAGRSDLWSIDIKPPYRLSLGLLRDKFSKFLKNNEDRAAKGPILALLQVGATTYFASADSYNVVWVWEAFTGKPIQRLEALEEKKDSKPSESKPIQKVVNAAVFSEDGKYIATASDDGMVRIWRLKLDRTL